MHRLQQHILYQLATNSGLKYSRLKPEEVEGNAFMYHLKSLIKDGHITNIDGLYQLTPAGQLYVDRIRLKTFTPPLQPKIVLLIVAQNDKGEVLFFRRSRHPLIGKVGFPYGKLHANETVTDAAARELKKKTGYEADFKYHSSGIMKIGEDGELISYILYLLVEATNLRGQLINEAAAGKPFWAAQETIPTNEIIPSIPDILSIYCGVSGGFAELNYGL